MQPSRIRQIGRSSKINLEVKKGENNVQRIAVNEINGWNRIAEAATHDADSILYKR